jgi:hypothetical protein
MELIPYSELAKLRLRQFCQSDIAESDSPDWEWMGGLWYCDAVGFTWFGRLREVPDETGGLEIDLSALPERESAGILAALHLPLHAGMSYDAITAILGEPFKTRTFVRDRKRYEFRVGLHQRYYVSCTVRDDGGLIFISVIRKDIFDKIEAA